MPAALYCRYWNADKARTVETMYESGSRIKDIATAAQMSIRSVQVYANNHISEEIGAPWKKFTPNQVNNRRYKDLERRQHVVEIIGQENSLNQKQIIDRLPDEFKCSRRTLQKDLRHLNITRKRLRHSPLERNDPTTIAIRHTYALEIGRIQNDQLFFIDETGTNLHTNVNHGYQFRGITLTIEERGNRGQNQSIVACIGLSRIVYWEHKAGAYSGESFREFVQNLLPKLPENVWIVLDNAPIHKSSLLRQLIEDSGRHLKFLPRYSPQLNPIEEFFNQYKAHQKSIRPRPMTNDALVESIHTAMRSVQDRDMSGYYRDMRRYIDMALANKKFL